MSDGELISFRPLQRDDIPGVVMLLADDPVGVNRESIEELGRYLDAYRAMIADPALRMIVAVNEARQVVGYVQITITRHLSYRGARRGLLEDLRVGVPYRGQRIGRRLVEAAIAAATEAGCDLVQLFVHHSRDNARQLYQNLGFSNDHLGMRLMLS
jgi:ribosomal protein S18 acetylase RimI-like enzyme